jgi:hypothetical protein
MDPGPNGEKKLSPGKGTRHHKRPLIAVSAFIVALSENLALSSNLFLKSLPSTGVTFYILHSQLSN